MCSQPPEDTELCREVYEEPQRIIRMTDTESGKAVGGEFRMSKKFGPYFLWPSSLTVDQVLAMVDSGDRQGGGGGA